MKRDPDWNSKKNSEKEKGKERGEKKKKKRERRERKGGRKDEYQLSLLRVKANFLSFVPVLLWSC